MITVSSLEIRKVHFFRKILFMRFETQTQMLLNITHVFVFVCFMRSNVQNNTYIYIA